ncbi:MAG: ABC transporter substrate-binding protein [Candidatus Hydrogenedentes bacterium]|nr:ABC transporter substrate-binding protein [Candidatus Hydrogenedentota bacterium]
MKRVVVCLLTLLILGGCGQQTQGPADTSTSQGNAQPGPATESKLQFAVIPKGLTHQFWLTVKKGAETAGAELGVDIVWIGPDKETDVVQQINIVEDMIGKGVDAIVMAACDQDALAEVVKRASDKGLPVVTIDSGVNSDVPVSFVATDNLAGAEAAARELAKLIGDSGPVGLIPFVKGAATSELREEGFKKGIAAFPNVQLVDTQYCDSDVAKAMDVTEDMLTAHPDLKGIFATNEPAAIGAVQAVEAAGKGGEFKIVAFDASPDQITALERGTIHALIVQNPFKMGYMGVKSAYDSLKGQPVEKRIDTGVEVITKDNLNQPEIQKLLNPLGN